MFWGVSVPWLLLLARVLCSAVVGTVVQLNCRLCMVGRTELCHVKFLHSCAAKSVLCAEVVEVWSEGAEARCCQTGQMCAMGSGSWASLLLPQPA
jgi:hypothetical protein